MIDKDKSKRLYRRVADELIAAVQSGQYAIGEKLPSERELAETMGKSRPTIREAIIALEILGIAEVRHGSGVYVIGSGQTPANGPGVTDLDVGAFELIEARMAIEGETAAIAANVVTDEDIARLEETVIRMRSRDAAVSEQADEAFHLTIARITDNGALIHTVERLWSLRATSPLASTIMSRAKGGGMSARIAEHEAIVAALRARDSAAARIAMRNHMERVREYVLEATEMSEIETLRQHMNAKRANLDKRTR